MYSCCAAGLAGVCRAGDGAGRGGADPAAAGGGAGAREKGDCRNEAQDGRVRSPGLSMPGSAVAASQAADDGQAERRAGRVRGAPQCEPCRTEIVALTPPPPSQLHRAQATEGEAGCRGSGRCERRQGGSRAGGTAGRGGGCGAAAAGGQGARAWVGMGCTVQAGQFCSRCNSFYSAPSVATIKAHAHSQPLCIVPFCRTTASGWRASCGTTRRAPTRCSRPKKPSSRLPGTLSGAGRGWQEQEVGLGRQSAHAAEAGLAAKAAGCTACVDCRPRMHARLQGGGA